MKIKRKAYISFEVVFLLTIMVISGMYVTIKLFNKGHNVSGQEAEAFSKVNHTVNNAINIGSSGGGGSGGGGGESTPSEPSGVIDTIYWGIDASGKLIISDMEVREAVDEEHKGNFPGNTVFIEDENNGYDPTTPWYKFADSIYSIEVVRSNRKVAPVSTAVWFDYLENISYIDVNGLDTSNVTDMYSMFNGCGSKTSSFTVVGLNTWDTSKVTNMSLMFSYTGYEATTFDIGNISNWDTSNVVNMFGAFAGVGSHGITELDLSGWDASNVTSMMAMFNGIDSLQTVKTPQNIPSTVDITDITSYDLWDITDNNKRYVAGTFPVGNGSVSHTLSFVGPNGMDSRIYWGIDASNTLIISDTPVTEATGGRSGSFSRRVVFDNESDAPWYSYRNNIYSIQIEKTGVGVEPVSTAYWFANLQNVTFVEVSNLNTKHVTNMKSMFADCGCAVSRFQIVGLENWDTSNVTDMEHMFFRAGRSASNNAKLDFTSWSIDSLERANQMFCVTGGNLINSEKFSPFGAFNCG